MARSVEDRRDPSRERERELVLAFQSGDQAAFETIVRTCRPAAERICRRLLVNPADVEEAVQETLVRAYQGLPRFNGSYALTAWVARIATNVSLDVIRATSRRPQSAGPIDPNMETPSDHHPNGDRNPEEILEQVVEAEEVRDVLAALPERHRTALVLREFEGYSHRHIAAMLDTSPQRVKALIHRAKAGFRRAWTDEHHPGRLAAFAPLLTPINWVRKLLGRAPEFDYSTTTSAAATASSVAASPVAQSFVTIASERVSVLATVMLAGTVGLAIQHVPNSSPAAQEPAEVQMAEPPEEQVIVEPVVRERAKDPKPAPAKSAAPPIVDPTPEPSVEPTPEPDPELEGLVVDEPNDSAQPDDAAAPTPEAPPHPDGFQYSFTSDRTADEACGCGSPPVLTTKNINVSTDEFSSYEGELDAAISDSTGQAAWPVEMAITADSNAIQLSFEVRTQYGTSPYDASGVTATVIDEGWGGWTVTYSGTYEWRGGPGQHADAPHRGAFSASLSFSWAENRLVRAQIGLSEAG